jgi:ABC-type Na+ efflux pump permease subunit
MQEEQRRERKKFRESSESMCVIFLLFWFSYGMFSGMTVKEIKEERERFFCFMIKGNE